MVNALRKPLNGHANGNGKVHDHFFADVLSESEDLIVVFDIGSGNSKFALYFKGSPYPYFPQKIGSNLGEGTGPDHWAINEEGVIKIEEGLRLFRPLWAAKPWQNVRFFATSAVRESMLAAGETEETYDVLKRWRAAAGGHRIRVLTGKEEANYIEGAIRDEMARFSELIAIKDDKKQKNGKREKDADVPTKTKKAFAAMGDGSIQFGYIGQGEDNELISIPYGTHPLNMACGGNIEAIPGILKAQLEQHRYEEVETLYVAGGTLRDVSEVILKKLEIEHGKKDGRPVEMSFRMAKKQLESVLDMRSDELAEYGVKSKDHQRNLIIGVTAFLTIMDHFKSEKIVFSNATVRQAVAMDDDFHKDTSPELVAQLPSYLGHQAPAHPVLI